jgi:drug/metabolite transporter (DMT)-like permease
MRRHRSRPLSDKTYDGLQFAAVSVILGMPYLFVKLALRGFSPEFVAFARTALAALVFTAVVGPGPVIGGFRRAGRPILWFAVVQFAVPLFLIAEAEQRISSALTGVLIASEPLWVALLATRLDRAQRSSRRGVLGVLLGLAGVALLLGVDNAQGTQLVGGLLVVAAAACYAGAALWLPRATARVEPRPLIAAGLAVACLVLAPFGAAALPHAAPSATAVVSLAVLAVVGTALGFSMWFALLGRIGAARASLVTYTSPVVAVALGAVALGESFHPDAVAGAGLIFVGSLLAARGVTVAARAPQPPSPDRTKTGVSPSDEGYPASTSPSPSGSSTSRTDSRSSSATRTAAS